MTPLVIQHPVDDTNTQHEIERYLCTFCAVSYETNHWYDGSRKLIVSLVIIVQAVLYIPAIYWSQEHYIEEQFYHQNIHTHLEIYYITLRTDHLTRVV